MLKAVAMSGQEKETKNVSTGAELKSHVFLVDSENVTRSNTVFLCRLKEYQVEDFEVFEMALNRLEQVWMSDMAPFCLVINHGDLNREVKAFLQELDARSFQLPVLVVDREKFNLRRDDYCRTLSPDFPLFVCSPEEIVEFLSHLHILRKKLCGLRAQLSNPGLQTSQGSV